MSNDGLMIPPYSAEAEQSILGGLLLDSQAFDRISDRVSEQDFYTSDNGIIFSTISRMIQRNTEVDIVTVAEELESHSLLSKVGGIGFLGTLAQTSAGSANIERYADIVRDRSLKRKMIQISSEISAKIYKPDGLDAKSLLDLIQGKWMAVGESLSHQADTMQHVNDVMQGVADHVDMMYSRDDQSDVTGLRTGITDLDSMTSGLQNGDLIIIAARPSMGKTAFALNVFEDVCLNQKKNGVFFSFEMPSKSLGLRLISSISKLPSQRVRIGRINNNEWDNLTTGFNKLHDIGMYFDDDGSLTVDDIRVRARRLHRKVVGGLGLIVIDYLGFINSTGRSENRAAEISEISRKLKALAKELNVPVVALSQLNRGLESRPNKRPIMSDLRESGSIEQDADLILFIYRDEVYHPDSADKGTAEIIVSKQRNGPIGTVRATFINHLTRFENYAHGNEQAGSHYE